MRAFCVSKQIDLDAWQASHLATLLREGAAAARRTNAPIVLYRRVVEEEDGSYEEAVCTLTSTHVVEQLVSSGGVVPPGFREQMVYGLDEYPAALLRKSRDIFREVVATLEEHLE